MKSLADLIGTAKITTPPVDPFLQQFGLSRNPFPTARTIIPDVIYNQQEALQAFANKIRDIIQIGEPQKRSLAVVGGTGSGKTHFLRHCQYLLHEYQKELPIKLIAIEFLAGASSITNLLRDILRTADDLCKETGELDFLTAIIRSMQTPDDFGNITFTDLRQVLKRLHDSTQPSFVSPDRDGRVKFDQLRDLTRRWLDGYTLTQTEKRDLGTFSRLATASLMARAVTELITLGRNKKILHGIVVCLDEIESLFTGQNSTSKIQQFLQDLRFFFDESVKDNVGFSLLIISASTQTGTTSIRDFNYPLFQRLGYEGDTRQPFTTNIRVGRSSSVRSNIC
jgi:energy-coupling factor transporter ATP-binding protein EcfA2